MRKRQRVQWTSDKPSMTQQNQKEQCDVNSILERYRKTGHLSHTRSSPGQYGDFSHLSDFRSNMEKVRAAQESFDALPSAVRKKFHNDPSNLMEFISNEENYDEALKMGLVNERAKPEEPKNDDQTTINPAPQG